MSESKEFTLQEIAAHNTKKDLYMVIHDKVYDCTSFVDEHPYVPSPSLSPCFPESRGRPCPGTRPESPLSASQTPYRVHSPLRTPSTE